MTLALCATSHSPLMGKHDPEADVRDEVNAVLERARRRVEEFAPDVVVVFGPDHYNGFLYDMMPSFCIGAAATSVGDYGTPDGPLNVDRDLSYILLEAALEAGVDLALSEDMQIDHGFVQPLTFLFDSIHTVPVVPIFINCVAEPLGPARRCRDLGSAIGQALMTTGRRVLLVGSGGLSHDPPVPRLAEATPQVVEQLKHGRHPSSEQRALRESRTIAAAEDFAKGGSAFRPLNPEWDAMVLDAFESGDLAAVDGHDNAWFVEQAGHSAHEVRTWVAAYAALAAAGPYELTSRYYRAIPEWFAGFATTTAAPVRSAPGALGR